MDRNIVLNRKNLIKFQVVSSSFTVKPLDRQEEENEEEEEEKRLGLPG